jgi:large subunit ribosomal protein L23
MNSSIISPLLTEKATALAAQSVYAFRVPTSATRIAIAQAFKKQFGILPVSVNIVRMHGKPRRFGRTAFHRADWKKAYVTAPKGTNIDLFPKN